LKISLGHYSDPGKKPINQDFLGARVPQGSLLQLKGVALAMADGISSSPVSQIASETAVKNFLDDYYCTSETWSVKNSADRVLTAINSWLYAQTRRSPHRYDHEKGYVCTFSALIIKNRTAHIFHIGDTRVYRFNRQGLEQLTHDHRLWVTPEESCLSRALGAEAQCAVDYQTLDAQPGDIFIIATDGVYDFIDAKTLIDFLQQHEPLNITAKNIVAHALSQQSDDNLSLQILRIDELPEQPVNEIKQQATTLPLPPTLEPRIVFDGYTILRELHNSNRSHVYLAQDNESKKNVVLKILSTEMAEREDNLERFLLEEWIALRINNPHVLKAALPEKKRNYIYTIFEYVEGQTLAQWAIDNPKPDLETLRNIIEQIAKGLNAFHRLEMLHQDLRPENIMIDKQGTIKIIDFGAASVAGLEETRSNFPDTHLAGTALYSAPEYFLGERGTVQSDLFSLGVISYFLLSGRYPYSTGIAKTKTLAGQKRLNYCSLFDEERAIPSWVDDAIRKAVHVVPFKRQTDVFEFIHDLRAPNPAFVSKNQAPLIERNPIAFWQGVSALLFFIILLMASGILE
jgi:serine/threonine protein kinase